MNKKYIVTLCSEERTHYQSLIANPRFCKIKTRRIQMLLATDQGNGGKQMTDEEIAKAYDVTSRTIRNFRKRCIEHGIDFAINGKPREVDPSRIKVTSEVKEQLIALSQNVPPSGFAIWTLRLLADQMVELDYIESISHEKVRQVLKKVA